MMQRPHIQYIDTPAALSAACEKLRHKKEFAFDTEFDRFYREYGFKLSFLQIFDGEDCYLIDPIALKDLHQLWVLFEDPNICKVVYSCSEDIQILKVNGCNPRNIYDIQIAAKFCNHPANSLADLMLAEFNVQFDKSMQRSNWRKRPLQPEQLTYAANDVSQLLQLKVILETIASQRNVSSMIAEENKYCEHIPVTEFKVKLSHDHRKKYNAGQQKILMELFLLRNEIAIQYNVPPANIVTDRTLENIMENKQQFLKAPFSKGFSLRLGEDAINRKRFFDLIEQISGNFITAELPPKKPATDPPKVKDKSYETDFDIKYQQLHAEITGQYGKDAGEHILRGFKKFITSYPHINKLKKYQQNIIDEACRNLKISFS